LNKLREVSKFRSVPSSTAQPIGLRERNKQERRERILEAIRVLVREDPRQTPTVERIAALAELAPATIFNLLGPRERQWEALCKDFMRGLDLDDILASTEDPRDQARRIVAETTEVFIADAAVSRYLLNSWGRSVVLLQENPIPPLQAALRNGQEAGMLRPDLHIEALAGHIATACGGALRLWAVDTFSDEEFRKRVRFAVDMTFSAGASPEWAAALSAPLLRKDARS
jgi:AcrR family transcriptional regulator